MKTVQIHFKAKFNFEEAMSRLTALQPQLVLMFGSHSSFSKDGLARRVWATFPEALMIGCSTAGEISNEGVYDDTLVVTACRFQRADIRPVTVEFESMDDSRPGGLKLGEQLKGDGLKGVFLLGKGLNINGSALIDGVREMVGHDVVITGGLAGDGGRFQETLTFLNGNISSHRVVGFGIYGDGVQIAYGSMGGWEPFGPVRRVTRAEKNVMFEIDGEPALDIYKKYLGDRARELPASGLLFPFAILRDDLDVTGLIRTILAVDENNRSLTFAGDIPQGSLVRLMHANNDGLVGGARGAAQSAAAQIRAGQPDDGLGILISCVGRKLVMGSDIDDEIDAVREEFGGAVTGFYSYGEICPQTGFSECKLHNQTMTITYLYEAMKSK